MFNLRNISSVIFVLAATFATCFASTGFAQTPSFGPHSYSTNNIFIGPHGDLNGDGYEDLITDNPVATPSGFSVLLSNGAGSYRTAASYTLPSSSGPVLLADFNQDGKLDLIVETTYPSSSFSLYLGNGDGTFRAPITHAVNGQLESIAAADVNHDNKTDLLLLTTSDSGNTSDLQVLFANGDGSFNIGPTTHSLLGQATILTGDFNGDGKADVAAIAGGASGNSSQIEIFCGDGHGDFTETYTGSSPYDVQFVAADINGDGISDLVGTTFEQYVGAKPYLTVFYGNSDGKMVLAEIQTTVYPVGQVAVADFNGDHIPDIAFIDQSNQSTYQVTVLSGKGKDQFGPETSVYTLNTSDFGVLLGLRGNRDTKADLVFSETSVPSGNPATLVTLLNTTLGNFPTCSAPNAAVGINVCSPAAGSSVSSPVNFAVGASGDTPMRDVQIWIDGKKQAQQLPGAFSNYSFLNATLPVAAGSHRLAILAVGWDGSVESKVSTLNVTSSSSCSAPSTAGVHICLPVNGSTVSSPVPVEASATVTGTISNMQLWVDGVKRYTTASKSLNTSVSLAAGTHRFAVLAINTAGQKWESAVSATVK
jgi:hypothetical protein